MFVLYCVISLWKTPPYFKEMHSRCVQVPGCMELTSIVSIREVYREQERKLGGWRLWAGRDIWKDSSGGWDQRNEESWEAIPHKIPDAGKVERVWSLAPRFLTCTNERVVVPTETRNNAIGQVGDSRALFFLSCQPAEYWQVMVTRCSSQTSPGRRCHSRGLVLLWRSPWVWGACGHPGYSWISKSRYKRLGEYC